MLSDIALYRERSFLPSNNIKITPQRLSFVRTQQTIIFTVTFMKIDKNSRTQKQLKMIKKHLKIIKKQINSIQFDVFDHFPPSWTPYFAPRRLPQGSLKALSRSPKAPERPSLNQPARDKPFLQITHNFTQKQPKMLSDAALYRERSFLPSNNNKITLKGFPLSEPKRPSS